MSAKKDKTLNIETVKYKPVHIIRFKEISNTGVTDKPKIVRRSLEFQDPQGLCCVAMFVSGSKDLISIRFCAIKREARFLYHIVIKNDKIYV